MAGYYSSVSYVSGQQLASLQGPKVAVVDVRFGTSLAEFQRVLLVVQFCSCRTEHARVLGFIHER